MSENKKINKAESEQIWEEIKNLPIAMFALPNQIIEQHALPLPFPGDVLMLRLVSTAVLPSLEEALNNQTVNRGKKYIVEVAEGYTIVRRDSMQKEELKKALAPFLIAK